jgi:hypothetical protein
MLFTKFGDHGWLLSDMAKDILDRARESVSNKICSWVVRMVRTVGEGELET